MVVGQPVNLIERCLSCSQPELALVERSETICQRVATIGLEAGAQSVTEAPPFLMYLIAFHMVAVTSPT